MAYILDGTTIKSPSRIRVMRRDIYAQIITLKNRTGRDYFGDSKKTYVFTYTNMSKTNFDTINTIYESYLSTGNTKSFQSTETNNTISSTSVHIDLVERDFNVGGSDYISDFDLVLTEA